MRVFVVVSNQRLNWEKQVLARQSVTGKFDMILKKNSTSSTPSVGRSVTWIAFWTLLFPKRALIVPGSSSLAKSTSHGPASFLGCATMGKMWRQSQGLSLACPAGYPSSKTQSTYRSVFTTRSCLISEDSIVSQSTRSGSSRISSATRESEHSSSTNSLYCGTTPSYT